MKARRGDAVAIVSEINDYIIGQGRTTHTQVELGIVTGITREGAVRTFRPAAYDDAAVQPLERVVGFQAVKVIPIEVVPTAAVIEVAKAHHFEGYPGQAKRFDGLAELKSALLPFRQQ